MANKTLYPFGQGGELPEGYPIVDDLETDSAQQALSARQGVVIKGMIDDLEEEIGDIPEQQAIETADVVERSFTLLKRPNISEFFHCYYPFKKGKSYSITVTLPTVVSMNFTILAIDKSKAGTQQVVGTITARQTTATFNNFVPSDNWLYLTLYAASGTYCDSFTVTISTKEEKREHPDFIVAASNTPAALKLLADYVCSGEHDENYINAAIGMAMNFKVNVRLLRGTYYLGVASNPVSYNYGGYDNAFIIIDTTGYKYVTVYGDDPFNRPTITISDATYNALSKSTNFKYIDVVDKTSNDIYSGGVEFRNIRLTSPNNQRKISFINMTNFGGWARLHSVGVTAYRTSYTGNESTGDRNNANVSASTPPQKAIEGCIGINFVAKGPMGAYGNEMTDCGVAACHEGVCINTEWAVLNHVYSIQCVTGWVFGKYRAAKTTGTSGTHPCILLNCGDERGVNLPTFYNKDGGLIFDENAYAWRQDIEMYAFDIERDAQNTPGGVLGYLAREVAVQNGSVVDAKGSFRGIIHYSKGGGAGNSHASGFWEYGHGHGMRTTDMTHNQAGTTAERMSYRPNFMQRYYDTDLNKEVICVDENPSNPVWKDAAGNVVSNS